jgi:hypothetical protein
MINDLPFLAAAATAGANAGCTLLTRHRCVFATIGNSTTAGSKYHIRVQTNSEILRYVRVEVAHCLGTNISDRGACRNISWIVGELHLISTRSGSDASNRDCRKHDNDTAACDLIHCAFLVYLLIHFR